MNFISRTELKSHNKIDSITDKQNLQQTTDQINSTSDQLNTSSDNKNIKKCQCDGCKKKLSIVDKEMGCKCGKFFCQLHKFFNMHNCTYDYKSDYVKILEKQNPKVEGVKLIPMSA